MIRRPPRSTQSRSSAASDVYKRQGVGPTPEEQTERGHDHRLSGTGLTGDGGESRTELKHGLLDHAERPDPDLLKHGGLRSRVSVDVRPHHAIRSPAGRTSVS